MGGGEVGFPNGSGSSLLFALKNCMGKSGRAVEDAS